MKRLPFPGRKREGEYLPATGNFVPGAGGLRREQKVPAWGAGHTHTAGQTYQMAKPFLTEAEFNPSL